MEVDAGEEGVLLRTLSGASKETLNRLMTKMRAKDREKKEAAHDEEQAEEVSELLRTASLPATPA
eukprot:7867182-Prorocentrum_lima.AAC.1